MTTIEDMHKELEDEFNNWNKNEQSHTLCSHRVGHFSRRAKLEGFNLGVEMARKEFLDKLENKILEQGGNWMTTKFIRELQHELKQSLEEKK